MLPEGLSGGADGALAALGQPLALLALLATAWICRPREGQGSALPVVAFTVAALAGGWLPPHTANAIIAALVVAVLGLHMAAGLQVARSLGWIIAAVAGVGFALACGLPLALPAEMAGSLAVGAAGLGLLLAGFGLLERRAGAHLVVRLGARVVGAWTAAVGLLLVALSVWGSAS